MRRWIASLLVASFAAVGSFEAIPVAAAAADKDCSDFSTQAAAQEFFIENGGPKSDPHRLDEDGDGVACESNPCPCSTNPGGGGGGGDSSPPTKRQKARITRVSDGDTISVQLSSGSKAQVRLLGIDTPEVPNQCGSLKATKKLKRLLPPNTRVLLVSDPSQSLQDRYGRLLRYVIRKRDRVVNDVLVDTDVNLRQIRRGMAKVLVVGKPFQRVGKYRTAQTRAKNQNRGLWKSCW